jgi:hypothetical protein
MSDEKPREVFAWWEHGGTCFDCDFDVTKQEGTVAFIEHNAYDAVKAERDALKSEVERLHKVCDASNKMWHDELVKERKITVLFRQFLNSIAKGKCSSFDCGCQTHAEAALNKADEIAKGNADD